MAEPHAQSLLHIQQLLAQGRTGEALADLQVLLARQPDHGRAQALYGKLLFHHLNDFTGAEEAFRVAMRNAAADPELYTDYGELLLRLDKPTETVAILNRALEVPGVEKDKIYHLFGRLYERQQKWENAVEYYTSALLYTVVTADFQRYRDDLERVKLKISL